MADTPSVDGFGPQAGVNAAEYDKIILIDDDPFTITMTEETVKGIITEGQAISFFSAADALRYLETEDGLSMPDTCHRGLILSDLHMPGIDGFQFLDEFAKLSRAVHDRYRVFILSSTTDKEDLARLADKAFLAGFCSKPLTTRKLRELMGN